MTELRRGPGRPRLQEDAPRPAVVYLRLPPALLRAVDRIVPPRQRSAWIRSLIEREVRRHPPPPEE